MKPYLVLVALLGTTLAAIVAATVIHRNQARTAAAPATRQVFQVKGVLRAVEDGGKMLRIAHEEIPGFMPAMEMPFTVKDPGAARGLAAGDNVQFELVVTKDDSWIAQIVKVPGPSASPAPPRGISFVPEEVDTGEQVPDFTLIDQDGRPFHLSQFRGKAVLLTFIYTRCPLPNFCPLMSKNFAGLQQRLGKEFPGKVQLLSISFDPEFDKPAVLRGYASAFTKDSSNWIFASGTPAQVDYVTSLFGLYREAAGGVINHDLRTGLISPTGKLVHVWRGNAWTLDEVARLVRETLTKETLATMP